MIQELEKMCSILDFDKQRAKKLLEMVDVNQVFISSWDERYPYETTLLNEAAKSNNIHMVEILLGSGANPNLVFDDTAVLWDLQYADEETEEEKEIRLSIARKLLENGANPQIVLDGEDLYHWAAYGMLEDTDDYRERFVNLLEEFIIH